jgi:hypothetical protein
MAALNTLLVIVWKIAIWDNILPPPIMFVSIMDVLHTEKVYKAP